MKETALVSKTSSVTIELVRRPGQWHLQKSDTESETEIGLKREREAMSGFKKISAAYEISEAELVSLRELVGEPGREIEVLERYKELGVTLETFNEVCRAVHGLLSYGIRC